MSTKAGSTLEAIAEMSDGAPAPVDELPVPDDPNGELPSPNEPEPNGELPTPEEPEPPDVPLFALAAVVVGAVHT
jgi:hypothetical protein